MKKSTIIWGKLTHYNNKLHEWDIKTTYLSTTVLYDTMTIDTISPKLRNFIKNLADFMSENNGDEKKTTEEIYEKFPLWKSLVDCTKGKEKLPVTVGKDIVNTSNLVLKELINVLQDNAYAESYELKKLVINNPNVEKLIEKTERSIIEIKELLELPTVSLIDISQANLDLLERKDFMEEMLDVEAKKKTELSEEEAEGEDEKFTSFKIKLWDRKLVVFKTQLEGAQNLEDKVKNPTSFNL